MIILLLFVSLLFVSLILFYKKGIEGFKEFEDSSTNHNVNMPLNTTFECQNKCSSQGKCYITKEQCNNDIDCLGCQTKPKSQKKIKDIRGQNAAGKLSVNFPTYSSLTTDIGTQAKLYTSNPLKYITPAQGLDRKTFNFAMSLQDEKNDYLLKNQPIIHYPLRQTATGMFTDIGPLPANAYLSDFKL
jgi:hypothetical protein